MSDFDETDERSFFQQHRVAICLGLLVMAGAVLFAVKIVTGKGGAPQKPPELPMVRVVLPPPPPPPPPTPPPPEPPQEQKMIEQTPVNEPETKPDDKPEPPKSQEPIGTGIKGDGPADGFGLGGSNGSGFLGGSKKGGGNSSRWGWYAGQVQSKIEEALRKNAHTRSANLNVKVRIWPDSTGRITRAQLVGTSGDAAVDSAINNEVLTGLQLQEPPPEGMPTPILMRLSARRPN